MAYFTTQKEGDTLLIYHKDASIIEHSVEGDKLVTKIHTSRNKESIYFIVFLEIYDKLPIIKLWKDGKKFGISEFKNFETYEEVLTKTALRKRLKNRRMNKDEIDDVFEDLDHL